MTTLPDELLDSALGGWPLTPKASVDALQRAAEILGPLRVAASRSGTERPIGSARRRSLSRSSEDDLSRISEAIRTSGIELLMLGNGSNMLVAQASFNRLVVTLGRSFDFVEIEEDCVRVGAPRHDACPCPTRRAAQGHVVLVWTVGIPGTVGGGVMNTGGHGADTARDLLSATVVDLASGTTAVKGTHSCRFPIVTRISPRRNWSWRRPLPRPKAMSKRRGRRSKRSCDGDETTNPAAEDELRLQNPPDDSAGRILDSLGLKGLRVGGAEISSKHTNFIQLDADGSSDDVDRLIELARAIVEERTGIRLEPEVRRIGFDR